VRAMLDFQHAGAEVFDYGNNIRQQAYNNGVSDAFEFPGFVPAYIRPLFCEGKGPFRWVALSGDEEDIYATDEAIMELFPKDDHLRRWLKMAREKVPFQGLVKNIRHETQRLMKLNDDNKPYFNLEPHITIARKLQPWQYEKGWLEYSNRSFTGRFIADTMVLLKRTVGEIKYKVVHRFRFQNLPVATKQGELFG